MKKLLVFASFAGIVALSSCNGNDPSNHTSNMGRKMDSVVNRVTSAIGSAADSIRKGTQNAADSLKRTADSADIEDQ